MRHQHISFIKSGFRFVGCFALIGWMRVGNLGPLEVMGWAFGIAEVIGIIEELGHE